MIDIISKPKQYRSVHDKNRMINQSLTTVVRITENNTIQHKHKEFEFVF